MDLPDFAALAPEARRAFEAADRLLARPDPGRLRRVRAWLRGDPSSAIRVDAEALRHPLSAHYASRDVTRPPSRRSPREISLLRDLTGGRGRFDPDLGFADMLHRIAGAVRREETAALRTRSCRSQPDGGGQYVVFPPPRQAAVLVQALDGFARRQAGASPMFVATVLMNGICNAHPFPDGNGRVSRIVFNAQVNQAAGGFGYLPLYELSMMSSGGFIIRLRAAQYHGDWSGLADYVHQAAMLFA